MNTVEVKEKSTFELLLTATTEIHDSRKSKNVAETGREGQDGKGGADARHAATVRLKRNTAVTRRRPLSILERAKVRGGNKRSTNSHANIVT